MGLQIYDEVVFAEKFDIGIKLAASLGGFIFQGKKIVKVEDIEKHKKEIQSEFKPKGYLVVEYDSKKIAITWANGHLCGLKQAYDYNPEYRNWNKIPYPFFPQYEIQLLEQKDYKTGKPMGVTDPYCQRQFNVIKEIFDNSKLIINSTDDDREGEIIFAYIYELSKTKTPYVRIKIDTQTEKGLQDSYKNKISSSMVKNIESAGRCRAILDYMCGSNLSAKATLKYVKYIPELPMISVGRVQTVILNFIIEREKAVRNFKSNPFWYVVADFTNHENISYAAKHEIAKIESKTKAEQLFQKINQKPGKVVSFEKKEFKKEVPLLYDLTMLTIDMSEKYGISGIDCQKTCQDLYDKGFISYPRTDSTCLTEDMMPIVDDVLEMLSNYSEQYKNWICSVEKRNYTNRHFNTKLVTSHYAIIPTNVIPKALTEMEQKIYDAIAKSLIRIIFKHASGENTTIITEVENEKFKSNGNVILDPQWLIVDAMPKDSECLPRLNQDEIVSGEYTLKEGKTESPKRYTDGTLLAAMKTVSKTIDDEELKAMLVTKNKGGIGRPSTQASIIALVVKRYCHVVKNFIIPNESGMKIIEMLPILELKNPATTAEWEMDLDRVEKGELSSEKIIQDMEDAVRNWCEIIDNDETEYEIPVKADTTLTDYKCPKCSNGFMRRFSWGWCCSNYKKQEKDAPVDPNSCNFFLSYKLQIDEDDIIDLLTKKKTKIKTFQKADSEETYKCILSLDANGQVIRSFDTGLSCPKCKTGSVMIGSKNWYCSEYKAGCKFVLWDIIYGKKISDNDKKSLILDKKTKIIKNFTGKDKATETEYKYDNYLILDENCDVKFPKIKKKGDV